MNIPLVHLERQYEAIERPLNEAVCAALKKSDYILGQAVNAFEKRFARWTGCTHAVGVSSGTEALHLALRALGVGVGDEVILPANTYIATALAVHYTGAKVVLVDCDINSALIDTGQLASKINARTKAIIPVHLFGQSADMDPILALAKKHALFVLEDAAQAHGALYKGRACGSMGDLAAFSFYPGKNLGCAGDGGAVTTKSVQHYEKLLALRNFGSPKKYVHDEIGWNARLDTLQAAILNVKMDFIEDWNQKRNAWAQTYQVELKDLSEEVSILQKAPWADRHVYHLFVVTVPAQKRDKVLSTLHQKEIGASVHYPIPIHLQKAFSFLNLSTGAFPNTERLAKSMISLPLCPYIRESEIKRVVATIKEALV